MWITGLRWTPGDGAGRENRTPGTSFQKTHDTTSLPPAPKTLPDQRGFVKNPLAPKPKSLFKSAPTEQLSILNTAVKKRCQTTERPIACLLSGGLDSSLTDCIPQGSIIVNSMDEADELLSDGFVSQIKQIVGDYATTDAVTTGLDLANLAASGIPSFKSSKFA